MPPTASNELDVAVAFMSDQSAPMLRALMVVLCIILAQAVLFLLASCVACYQIGAPPCPKTRSKRPSRRSVDDVPGACSKSAAADSRIAGHAPAAYRSREPSTPGLCTRRLQLSRTMR